MTDEVILEQSDIMELIPHRDPFLLIDRADKIVIDSSIRGMKKVTAEEPYFAGHFPGHPIMPGVLIVESMAQTASILVAYGKRTETAGKYVYFTGIDKARFRAPVFPGCVLYFDVKVIANRGALYKMEGVATVDGKTVADAAFSAMVVDG